MKGPAGRAGAARAHRAPVLVLGACLVLAGAAYWPGLGGDLVLDDWVNLQPVAAWAAGEADWRDVLARAEAGVLGRPVAMLSFMASFALAGPSLWHLKFGNLVLHLAGGLLTWGLARRLLAPAGADPSPAQRWAAVWVAAAWLLAPLYVSTVLYTVQRMAQLSALFVLAGLLCYLAGRERLESRPRAAAAWLAAAFIGCWPLAVLSKENGALLPLLACVVEAWHFRFEGTPRVRRRLLALFALLLGVPALGGLAWVAGGAGGLWDQWAVLGLGPWERVMTEARVLWAYVAGLLLLPGAPPFGIYHDQYVVSRALLDPPVTALALAAWVGALGAAWRWRRGRAGPVGLGIVFFVAAHALESSVLPLETYFEHRNYLPGIGVYLAVAGAALIVPGRPALGRACVAVLALAVLGWAGGTFARAHVWSSWEGLLLAAAETPPVSPRVHTGLASVYLNAGRRAEALAHLDRAEALYAGRHALALALHRLSAWCPGDQRAPPRLYARIAGARGPFLEDYSVNALAWLAGALERGTCAGVSMEALSEALRTALARTGEDAVRWQHLAFTARLLAASGRRADAVELISAALRRAPGNADLGLLAGRYRLRIGDLGGARTVLDALAGRDPPLRAAAARTLDALRGELENREREARAD